MDYIKKSASVMDNNSVLKAEKEEYTVNLYEHVIEIKEVLGRVETKVDIHNNYEGRIRNLEKKQYLFLGAFFVINFITNLGVILLIKFL